MLPPTGTSSPRSIGVSVGPILEAGAPGGGGSWWGDKIPATSVKHCFLQLQCYRSSFLLRLTLASSIDIRIINSHPRIGTQRFDWGLRECDSKASTRERALWTFDTTALRWMEKRIPKHFGNYERAAPERLRSTPGLWKHSSYLCETPEQFLLES